MEGPVILWSGEAAGDRWELHLLRVHEEAVMFCQCQLDEDESELPHQIVWSLVFVGRSGERIAAHWYPESRSLGVQLRGWSTHSIGILKRRLIAMGADPRV